MRIAALCVLVLGSAAFAAAPVLDVILNVRDDADIEGNENIGQNGGVSGGYENVDYGQQFVMDGTWQQMTFDLANANANGVVTGWITGNGVIDSDWVTIDAIMLSGNFNTNFEYHIDAVVNTIDANGPLPGGETDVMLADSFQNQADGAEVMFRHPAWSGSTSGVANSAAGVDNTMGYDDSSSYLSTGEVDGAFFVRQTAYQTGLFGNPMVSAQGTVSFWMRGTPEPASLALLAIGGLAVIRRR